MLTKSGLAIELSRLQDFEANILQLEQYSTPSEIAADLIWKAHMLGDIKGKIILDPACGPGFLGIGCLLLGAKKVIFLDIDENSLGVLKNNLKKLDIKKSQYEIVNQDIKDYGKKAEVIIQNPPFGTKKEHADRIFLEKAFSVAPVIYSMHKVESKGFIQQLSKERGYRITHYWEYDFQLKATQKFHKRKIHRIKVGCWRLSA